MVLSARKSSSEIIIKAITSFAPNLGLDVMVEGHFQALRNLATQAETEVGGEGEETSFVNRVLSMAWSVVLVGLMVFFLVGTIQEVARQRAARLDEGEIQAKRDAIELEEVPHIDARASSCYSSCYSSCSYLLFSSLNPPPTHTHTLSSSSSSASPHPISPYSHPFSPSG